MGIGYVILLLIIVAIVTSVVSCWITRKKDVEKVTYMLDAFEDGELNFRFKDKNRYNKTLNRLRNIFYKQRVKNEQESWSKLIRILTHEIMNTLSPIISITESLHRSISSGNHDLGFIKEGVEIINESSNNMKKFIDDYRRLSGLSRPVYEEVNVAEFVNRIIGLHRDLMIENRCECRYVTDDDSLMIKIDDSQISQVLINLLKNAIQAGASKIEMIGRKINNSGVYLQIFNNGEPINHEIKEMIFVPFFTTKTDGTGIGLSISRQIMQQHGGSIDLQKSNRNGTVFELHFP
ncbi:MAG: HAMP domain-containing histidine kinase [Muribaculaceae bacterium]|nr:HAMP domain-containing histidine kinase [Muribaculaceae bacterium]